MKVMGIDADDVIDEIDVGILKPLSYSVARSLFRNISSLDDVVSGLLAAFDGGAEAEEMSRFQADLWAKIGTLDIGEQGAFRLAICLTRPEEAVDWQLAGYFVLWAREQGVSEESIYDSFHERANRN